METRAAMRIATMLVEIANDLLLWLLSSVVGADLDFDDEAIVEFAVAVVISSSPSGTIRGSARSWKVTDLIFSCACEYSPSESVSTATSTSSASLVTAIDAFLPFRIIDDGCFGVLQNPPLRSESPTCLNTLKKGGALSSFVLLMFMFMFTLSQLTYITSSLMCSPPSLVQTSQELVKVLIILLPIATNLICISIATPKFHR
mmetsp:Transcript_14603/g.21772  ORF Transcript_14603/g.21772 Transcript_14603/m.21772 type:complete len:202 (-) Transcript_14603:1949-2554(-)